MKSHLFDIVALAFGPGPDTARATFEVLVERYSQDSQPIWGEKGQTLFRSIDGATAAEILKGLDPLGVRTEIRPAEDPVAPVKLSPPGELQGLQCPSCGIENPESSLECNACGVVFAKFEQRAVRQMMADAQLEQEINKAQKIQQEWDDRASSYRANQPLPADATAPFAGSLLKQEVPFLNLRTGSGPMLFTSKRILASSNDGVVSIPFEMIAGVDLGGGFTILGGTIRMVLTFKAPLILGKSRTTTLSRQIRKDESYDRETILHWVYSKNFICNGCGARDLSYRFENLSTKARCMRCASDHLIDLTQAIAKPIGEKPL